MNYSLIFKSGLLLIILTTDLLIDSSVWADIDERMPQQQKEQLRKPQNFKQLSDRQWTQFRWRIDQQRLIKQQQIEQFRLQNELGIQRQQQPYGQFRLQQLRMQQKQQLETLRLQQQLRKR